jgi:hemerythrin superfamily protein
MFSLRSIALKSAITPLNFGIAPAAALRRSYSGTIRAMATITEAITRDHREIEQYYNEVVNNPGNHDHQQRFGNQFTWELARHSIAEELVVYPAFEKYLGDKGKQMAEEDRKEHHQVCDPSAKKEQKPSLPLTNPQQVKELLKVFQSMSPTDPDYIAKLKEIWTPLSSHIKGEEDEDLVRLEAALKDASQSEQTQQLATTFGRYKAFVPSRSHPAAGEHPPFETVMGLLTAPIDHVADLFRKFPGKTISPNPSTK